MISNVRQFRKAIIGIDPSNFNFGLLSGFPKNCCEFSSYLLAKYLVEECYITDVLMVHGENKYKKYLRHVWLKVNSYDVDITADQFSSSNKTVFCVKNSDWHKRFHIYESYIPNIQLTHFHDEYKEQLLADYNNVLRNI